MDLILEDERHILVEEQKACRARARKFSLETNRRRKALEERKKEEDEREQRLREDILQQRKNKVQDATERFQRAHLPPSQRRRQAPRKATPQLEEALNQIQGPLSSSSAHATLFNSPTNNRSYAPSPSASRYQRQLSAAVAYAKLMQERSSDNFKTSQLLFQNELQETQRLLEEKQVNSLQEFQREVSELGRSESLSSLDSLENESSHRAHTVREGCVSCSKDDNSEPLNCARPQSPQTHCNGPYPVSAELPWGVACNGGSDFWKNRVSTSSRSSVEETDKLGYLDRTTQVGGELVTKEPKPGFIPSDQAMLTQSGTVGCTISQTGRDPQGIVINATEKLSHLPRSRLTCNEENSCNKDTDFETKSTQSRPSGPLNPASKNYHVRVNKGPGHETQITSAVVSASTSTSKVNSVKSPKGILKKESKYVTCHTKITSSPINCMFTNHVAVSIKDSVELAKQKDKDPESSKTVKKKLRWFDEVHLNEEEEVEEDARPLRDPVKNTAMRSKTTQPSQGKSVLVGNQEDLVQAAHLVTTPAVCVGHCAKQAWSDSRAQDSKLQVRGEDGQHGKTSPRRGRARVPRRVRSARARLGHAPSRTRKGTVVRPQSASEASQVFKTQGKIIMPRPPPKSGTLESRLAPGSSCTEEALLIPAKSMCSDVQSCSRPGPPSEQALHKDVSGGCAIPAGQSIVMASGITFTPFPPSYAFSTYENITKAMYTIGGSHSAGQQEALGAGSKRWPQYAENSLNMEQTPTDEEISQLWHGVRSALATKGGDPRNFASYSCLLSGLSHARANVPQVTNDGSNLISDIKAVTRMGGFFVTTSNGAKSPVRRKQITDSNGKKHRALLEQRRLAPASGTRRPPVPAQLTRPLLAVSDSTAQFLLAENLAESSATDADILAAMETVQTQRQGMVQHVQHLGPSALSLEEQRLLLSLDRLNHRLQSVQNASAGNPSVPSLLQIGAPSQNLSSRPGEGQGTPQRRYRVCSADGRGRPQKRF
ncbi:centrosomal protein of 126 kDa [Megalops cyprinoides]|uniref:centrosomal protein of 126 kDa n=1 Tax=Megalops cyprinoides TaxID=118141 RepID=UPI0018647845|nr:centrosomal protein of 126 kDa [Megalops cyprinoides]